MNRFAPAKKSLGQNFLVDVNAIQKIIDLIPNCPLLLEIGPGRGALSGALADRTKQYCALEKDDELSSSLKASLSQSHPNYKLWNKDALEFDWEKIWQETQLPASTPLTVAANLPYNVATEIFFHLLPLQDRIPLMVLMFQKEVGLRFAAPPGGADYGIISVFAQNFYEVKSAFILKPGSFRPAPKIDSSVVVFKRLAQPRVILSPEEWPQFQSLVKAAFQHRRKTLENSLALWRLLPKGMQPITKNNLGKVLESARIDGSRRAQTLSVEEFGQLFHAWRAYAAEER